MSSKNILSVLSGCVLILFANSLYAHARLKLDSATPPRYTSDDIKTDPDNVPCGIAPTDSSSSIITGRISIFQVNETITVDWEETIEHAGYYVFEFAPADDTGFDNPANLILEYTDDQTGASRSNPNNYQAAITLPDQPCDACTLRMRQYMLPQKTNYLSCADIVLVSGENTTPPSMAINATATPGNNVITLNWDNPTDSDFKAIVVTRNTVSNNDTANNRTHYLVNDTLGSSSTVIYRGTASSFEDSGLSAGTTYYYNIYSYNTDYIYSNGTMLSASPDGTVTPPPVTPPVTPPDSGTGGSEPTNDSGGGSLFFMLLTLFTGLGYRYKTLNAAAL